MGLKQRIVERWMDDSTAERYIAENVSGLREALDDLEMEILRQEDLKWVRLTDATEDWEFSQQTREQLNKLALYYWMKNPLAGRAVETMTHYTFGRGVTVTGASDEVNGVIEEFWDDEDNKAVLTRHQAQEFKSNELQIYGNVFLVLFANQASGHIKLGDIPDNEVKDIIRDVDNRHRPRYYKRIVGLRDYDFQGHAYVSKGSNTWYYPDWKSEDDREASKEAGGGAVYHVKVNCLSDMKFGVTELYRAMDWLKAYNKFLENWASITAAFARFAWKKKVKGGASAVAAEKLKHQSGLAAGRGVENNPAPAAASMWIENMGSDLQPIRTHGATTSAADGRWLKLMVCAGTGIFEHYFGDPSTGNLATACYDEETEYLSEQGWRTYDQWQGERVAVYDPETERLRYETPKSCLVYSYDGELIHFGGKSVDCVVTPNHRMWVQMVPTNNSKNMPSGQWQPWEFKRADSLVQGRRHFRFLRGARLEEGAGGLSVVSVPTAEGAVSYPASAFLDFLGYFIGDGVSWKSSRGYKVELAMKVTRKVRRFQEICDNLGLPVTRSEGKDGMQKFVFTNKALALFLEEHVGRGAVNKRLPFFIWRASVEEKAILWRALLESDGHDEESSGYYSTSSGQLADDVQRLLVELGYATRLKMVRQKPGCSPEYIVHWRVQEWQEGRPENASAVAYAGKVWCFSTSTGIFITRRNGAVAIHGNTAMELPMLKKFESRQQLWQDVYTDLVQMEVDNAVAYGRLKVSDPEDLKFDVKMPPIVTKDAPALVSALVEAVNLGAGGNTNGLIPMEVATRMVLNALGEENPEKVIAEMYADEGGAPGRKQEKEFVQQVKAMSESLDRILESAA